MDFLQQKEELENKLKNINNYWDDLKIKQEEKFKKREEYKEPKKHLYYATHELLTILMRKIIINYNTFDNYIVKYFKNNWDTRESFFENQFLIFFIIYLKTLNFNMTLFIKNQINIYLQSFLKR